MEILRSCCLFLCLYLLSGALVAQRYFKIIEKPDKSYHKKIDRFANGDLLVADSPVEGVAAENRNLILVRMDPCGNTVWSKRYIFGQNYLEFKDLQIASSGEIYIYGSAYHIFDEWIFLLKLNADGEVLKFRLFNGGTVDHFTFSIDLRQDRLLAYGLLLDWNSQKQGFVAVFDQNLVFQWGKKFAPFESFGDAIITRDGGFFCRSGSFLYKLDANGALQWAFTLENTNDAYPLSGPFELDDGYLFELYDYGFGSFFKVDLAGQLIWQSAKFPSTKHASDLYVQADGQILAAWNLPGTGENRPALQWLSPTGAIVRQHQLSIGQSINTGLLDLMVDEDHTAHLVGSADPFSYSPGKISDFLLRFQLDSLSGDCLNWEPLQAQTPNDLPLNFIPLDTIILKQTMQEVPSGGLITTQTEVVYREMCDSVPALFVVPVDTLLPCNDAWMVELPGPGFHWDDGSADNPRALLKAGMYRASSRLDCDKQVAYEYTLRKQPCTCPVYFPNAFRPDIAGANAKLEYSCPCSIQQVELTLFDRWGNAVFESRSPDEFWDGTFRRKTAPEGVYIAILHFKALDNAGVVQEGSLIRDVTLFR